MNHSPTVTIGIPVLNEAKHIEGVIKGFLHSAYPNLLEILIADGGSTDGTRAIVQQISKEHPKVKLVDNPEKYQSFALNKMINQAQGEIFLRADGHCIYANDYISACVTTLLNQDAKNVGGAQRYIAENRVQAGIALAMKSFLGNGNAKYKREDYNGFADTVFLGCFWTKDLKEIGGFSKEQITSQDLELNLRLKRAFGPCVYVSSSIKSSYLPRRRFTKLLKQYFKHGRGRAVTIQLHHTNDEFRGIFPLVFLLALIIYTIVDLMSATQLYSLYIIAFLALVLVGESIRVSLKQQSFFEEHIWAGKQKSPGRISNSFYLMISLALMQLGHFTGVLFQFLKSALSFRKGW